jgi:hypothetical protein
VGAAGAAADAPIVAKTTSSTVRTSGVAALTNEALVTKGAKSILTAPAEQQATAGQAVLLGGTTLNELASKDNGAVLKNSMIKQAQAMLADPSGKGAALDADLKKSGISGGIAEATASGVLGFDDFLRQMQQMMLSASAGKDALTAYYTDVAKRYGITPDQAAMATEYINGRLPNMTPEDKAKLEAAPWFKMYRTGQSAAYTAYVNDNLQDPVLNAQIKTAEMLSLKDPSDVTATKTLGELTKRRAGNLVTAKIYGPKELSSNPDQWQAVSDSIAQTLPVMVDSKWYDFGGAKRGLSTPMSDAVTLPDGQNIKTKGVPPRDINAIKGVMNALGLPLTTNIGDSTQAQIDSNNTPATLPPDTTQGDTVIQ